MIKREPEVVEGYPNRVLPVVEKRGTGSGGGSRRPIIIGSGFVKLSVSGVLLFDKITRTVSY